MTIYKSGNIVLVKFPFTDLSASKKRPVIVINSNEYSSLHIDIVVLALTSQQQDSNLRLSKWKQAGLPKPTWIKPLRGSLQVSVVEKKIGDVAKQDHSRIQLALQMIIAPEFLIS